MNCDEFEARLLSEEGIGSKHKKNEWHSATTRKKRPGWNRLENPGCQPVLHVG